MHAGRGIASNHYLLETYQKTLEGYFRMWHHHFEFLLLGYGAYMTFFAFCKKAFPEISDQTVARMVAGMEAEIFRPDEEVRRLARRAVELGVDAHFEEGRDVDGRSSRRSSRRGAPGREWLAELETSRDPWFNINVGDGFYHYHRSWNDDLSMPFAGSPATSSRSRPGESLERPVEKLQAERRQLIADYRELLGTDEERGAYDQMIALAHRVFPYVEGHKFYCEHWYTNLFFNKIREFGALLAANGFFADAEDVFQLTHFELESAIIDLMTSWSHGLAAARARALAGERRASAAPPSRSGRNTKPRPRSGRCPTSSTIRRSSCCGASRARASIPGSTADEGGDTNEIRGFAASSGVVEGPARVVQVGRGNLAPAARRHPRVPGHESDLGADLPEDRRRRVRHRRLDEPRRHRRARVRTCRRWSAPAAPRRASRTASASASTAGAAS